MNHWPSWKQIDCFLDAYLDTNNLANINAANLTDFESEKEIIISEIKSHMPFVILAKMILDERYNSPINPSHIETYLTVNTLNY